MLIQSYQPGYNVQHWCGLDNPYLDNDSLEQLPEIWFRPSDSLVGELRQSIAKLYSANHEERAKIWSTLPFNPSDPLVQSDRMENLAFDASRITFDSPQTMGATLRGLQESISALT